MTVKIARRSNICYYYYYYYYYYFIYYFILFYLPHNNYKKYRKRRKREVARRPNRNYRSLWEVGLLELWARAVSHQYWRKEGERSKMERFINCFHTYSIPLLQYWMALMAGWLRRCWEEKTTRSNQMNFRLSCNLRIITMVVF